MSCEPDHPFSLPTLSICFLQTAFYKKWEQQWRQEEGKPNHSIILEWSDLLTQEQKSANDSFSSWSFKHCFPLLQLLTTGHSHHAEISTGNFRWVPTTTECQSRRGRLTQENRVSAENQSEGKGKCHSGVLTLTVHLNTHPILVCGRGSHPPSMYVTQGAQGPTMLRRACVLSSFNCVWLFATLWTVARRTLLSMGFSRQECCSGSLFPCSSPQFKSR